MWTYIDWHWPLTKLASMITYIVAFWSQCKHVGLKSKMVEVWNFSHDEPTCFPNNEACLWLWQMVYVEVIFQQNVE
jgi:hypothetical protein